MLDFRQMIEQAQVRAPETASEKQALQALESQLKAQQAALRKGGFSEDEAAVRAALQLGLRAALQQEQLRAKAATRYAFFEKRYPHYVRGGFLGIALIPLLFLILMFSLESKILFLVLWIVSILAISAFLICVEYLHDHFQRKWKPYTPEVPAGKENQG